MQKAQTIPLANLKDKLWRLEHFYKIKDKDRRITNLKLNPPQRIMFDYLKKILNAGGISLRYFILKARQMGISTFWLLWWLDDTIFRPNTTTGILAHKWDSLKYLMDIIKLAYETMPPQFKPRLGTDSAHELSFPEINSKIFISLSIRSTTIHNLHISEWCLCDDEEIWATLAAVPPNGNITGESTGNGTGNDGYLTYQEAKLGKNKYHADFFPWYFDTTYTLPIPPGFKMILTIEEDKFIKFVKHEHNINISYGNILWRRDMKRSQKRMFQREFPEIEDDAFAKGVNRYFNGRKIRLLMEEAKRQEVNYYEKTEDYICFEKPEKHDIYVAGADCSEGANDYSVLKIINVTKRREAFMFRARVGVDYFYKVCDKWGREYNNAFLAVERNNHGHAVLLGLEENCRYPNLYKEEESEKRLGLQTVKSGWLTTRPSKTMMLDQFKEFIEGNSEDDEHHFRTEIKFLDINLMEEALTFVELKGKLGSEQGKFDDDIIATAIAMQLYKDKYKFTFDKRTDFGIHVEPSTTDDIFRQK